MNAMVISQASAKYGISTTTIHAWRRAGRIKCIRAPYKHIKQAWCVPESEIPTLCQLSKRCHTNKSKWGKHDAVIAKCPKCEKDHIIYFQPGQDIPKCKLRVFCQACRTTINQSYVLLNAVHRHDN
jgi:hypothetical protein